MTLIRASRRCIALANLPKASATAFEDFSKSFQVFFKAGIFGKYFELSCDWIIQFRRRETSLIKIWIKASPSLRSSLISWFKRSRLRSNLSIFHTTCGALGILRLATKCDHGRIIFLSQKVEIMTFFLDFKDCIQEWILERMKLWSNFY